MTPAQSRAARGLLDWRQVDLARNAGVGESTVVEFEREKRKVGDASITKMQVALEDAGVEFTNGRRQGVRLKASP